MAMRRHRVGARPGLLVVIVAGVMGAGATIAACNSFKGPLGDACMRDDDCFSQVCSAQRCVSAPTTFALAPEADGSADAGDASADAALDAVAAPSGSDAASVADASDASPPSTDAFAFVNKG